MSESSEHPYQLEENTTVVLESEEQNKVKETHVEVTVKVSSPSKGWPELLDLLYCRVLELPRLRGKRLKRLDRVDLRVQPLQRRLHCYLQQGVWDEV